MTVKDLLETINTETNIIVRQKPISRIDSFCGLVERQRGACGVLLDSNQNYLDYEVLKTESYGDTVEITCKASPAQEIRVINAFYNGRM